MVMLKEFMKKYFNISVTQGQLDLIEAIEERSALNTKPLMPLDKPPTGKSRVRGKHAHMMVFDEIEYK